MKSPESFGFSPEDDSLSPEVSSQENVEPTIEGPEETPEFNEERIDRERLRNAIGQALSDSTETGMPTTIEELRARAAELADKFEGETADKSVTPEELREAYRKLEEEDGAGPQSSEVSEEEIRKRAEGISDSEDWRNAA